MRKKREPYYCENRKAWIIPLTMGKEALVDEEDVEDLGKYNWHWGKCKTNIGYAISSRTYMHRQVMTAEKGFVIDHINGNSLDNRKANLRVCSNRENQQNRHIHRSGRMVGASFHKRSKKWQCVMMIDGKLKHKGLFKTELEAHEAYKEALKELAGD